ncbi:MAG: hypothetical protein ACRET5_09140, partial [Steroidobacteraceae bacterium]
MLAHELEECFPAAKAISVRQAAFWVSCSGRFAQCPQLLLRCRLGGLVIEAAASLEESIEQKALSGATPPDHEDQLRLAAAPGALEF